MQNLYTSIYVEVNLICVFFLFYILHTLSISLDQRARNISFRNVVIAVIAVLIIDCFWVVLNGNTHAGMPFLSRIIMAAYLSGEGLVGYCWLIYAADRLGINQQRQYNRRLLFQLPMLLLDCLSAASIWTGWLFVYDAAGQYQRGPWFALQFLIPIIYFVLSLIDICHGISTAAKPLKDEYLILLLFVFIPVFGSLLEILFQGIPTIWPLAALALLFVYLDFQNYEIKTDSLTGLNNRRQFDIQLNNLIDSLSPDQHICMILMDIDHFKNVNDQYGHYEGDRALSETAGLLKLICQQENVFLSRFGGDEFTFLFSEEGSQKEQQVRQLIPQIFAHRNQSSSTAYALNVSVGIGIYRRGQTSVEQMFEQADHELYQQKQLTAQSEKEKE